MSYFTCGWMSDSNVRRLLLLRPRVPTRELGWFHGFIRRIWRVKPFVLACVITSRGETMNIGTISIGLLVGALATGVSTQTAWGQSQAFTYQGELRSGGNLSEGSHDLRFELLDAGGVVRQTLCADDVPVTKGLFTVQLDPGADFPNLVPLLRSIRILVRPNSALPCSDSSGFTALTPVQPFSRTPLASRASLADRAVTADTFAGQLPGFYTNAANLTGTIADARLSGNVPRLASGNLFSANNTFNGLVGIGLGNAAPQFPLDIAAPQAVAKLASVNSQTGSVLSLANGSPILATSGGTLGAINFDSGLGTDGQIAYQWDANSSLADSLQFRVGGLPWAALTGSGSLGVGVLDPAARLHVRNGLASVSPNPGSSMVMETAGGGYFNLLTRDAFETGLLFGTPTGGAEDAGIIYNNPSTPSGLQFRTGGNITRMSITNTGAVLIPGVLISGTTVIDDVQYSTPKVTFANITPADFSIVTNFSSVKSLGFGEYATIPNGFVSDQLTAGVHLPHGAVVTQVIVWMYDNSSTKNLTAQFVQVEQFTRSPALRGTGTSGTSAIFSQAIDCTPVPNLTIDNQNSFYRIAISTANNQPWDGNLGVAGVRIEYQMSSPIP